MSGIDNPAITVGEMKAHGVQKVWAACELCGKRWLVPVEFLPASTSLATIAELIICPNCGDRSLMASPASLGRA
jgi:DNA-directed RNA polymerase subunit RPC12/RpoP